MLTHFLKGNKMKTKMIMLVLFCVVSIVFASSSFQRQADYHRREAQNYQRQVMRHEKNALRARERVQYHEKRALDFERRARESN